jgi:carbamoyl-phosphate synthase/aspartate carbamoyltransferase
LEPINPAIQRQLDYSRFFVNVRLRNFFFPGFTSSLLYNCLAVSLHKGSIALELSLIPSIMAPQPDQSHNLALELQDGYVCFGNSFGADKSISGELVFQTGMVGYPESITDPSYRGQILVITFPLVGNYGVPSREEMDALLEGVPAHFESSEIHIAGLVVATYAGEEYSHHLATSSLGAWLKEQGVPAITGVDTRALTKRIREEGSMLGRLMQRTGPSPSSTSLTNGAVNTQTLADDEVDWRSSFEQIEWLDPNKKNLVAEGIQAANLYRDLL